MSRRTRLSDARIAAGYSQEALAEQLGVERTTVQRWESGASTPRPFQRANLATALGLTAEAMEATLGLTPSRPQPFAGAEPSPLLALQSVERGRPAQPGDVLGLLDAARPLIDNTLGATSLSPRRLELIEGRIAEHLVTYTRTPPVTMLSVLATDILEIQAMAAVRQPAMVQAKLSEAQAILALLTADALMKLGEIRRARYWYGTARLASDDTGNLHLQARVRAQEAMLPYYYGPIAQAVELARSAQALLPGVASETTALAAAAEGRALARLGDAQGAEQAMNTAQRYVDQADSLGSPDAAFQFNHKRLLLYLSGTLTYLDQPARTQRVQEEALQLYAAQPDLVTDPALIRLDQAVGLALAEQADEACRLAMNVVTSLPAEYRTRVVLAKTHDVVRALPEGAPQRPRAELTELIATQT
ncbi:helix-turn-helix domain-containing protein [Promicromonospora sp. CA-289599]|uniref:helix-turn-helix transcriptional regulator n=1 Tax=Promicromonospora sp. CA-289599 TaxID=3240014 RepID=UPI003D8D9BA3